MRLLVIENDLILSDLLINILLKNYFVDLSSNLNKISNLFDKHSYQAILLSSCVFCNQQLKNQASQVFSKSKSPVLLLSAGNISQQDYNYLGERLIDFLHKPFTAQELNLRLGLILFQLPSIDRKSAFNYQNLFLDKQSHKLCCASKSILLTRKEFYLLRLFFKRPKQLLSKALLANLVWDDEEVVYGNSIATHLSSLRRKIKLISGKNLINVVRGDGYFLDN